MVHFEDEDDIINPCWDNVFKATFTRNSPESRGALENLLCAIIGRRPAVLSIAANEPPVDSVNERQIRYDLSCKFDDGELCNIEMTLNPNACEPVRLEYYSGKLFVSQDIRGKGRSYSGLKHTYQISLLVNAPIIDDDVFVHYFEYYDAENGISLGGKSQIITIELSKLEQIAKKPVAKMKALERWGVFFKYSPDKGKRGLVNEIIKAEEGIAMAGQVLLTFSKDENERAWQLSEYKFAVDHQSNMVDARRAGVKEGEAKGVKKGIKQGVKQGIIQGVKQGSANKAVEIARKLLDLSMSIEEIMEVTGLTREEIERLRDRLPDKHK
jgi:predicted transposase/invertase (TIGR01784 family)